ncbi:MAG: trans-sulfuration enzyme family protein, partial [Caldilinea sp.]
MPTHKLAGQPQPTTDTTQAVHAGEARFRAHHSLTVPIVQSAVYTFASTADLVAYTEDRLFWEAPEREEYGRYGNPTVRALEAKIAELEGAQDAIAVGSGMAAVTATLLLLLQPGQHFLLTDQCYPSTLEFSQKFLRRYGIDCTLVPFGDDEALTAAIRPETRLIFSESPTNPFMRCLDLERLVAIARRHQLLTVVDATFATPYNQRPLQFGVDLVIHSLTKYLGGHNDLMGGSVAGRFDLTTPLRQMQHLFGCLLAPQTAYLTLRGIKTLPLRVAR